MEQRARLGGDHRALDAGRGLTPLYFLHVPHTAGTTLSQLLEGRFPPGDLFPPGLLPGLLDLPDGELGRFRLFRGHFGLVLPRRLEWRVRCVTVLRDPLEQTLALYAYMRRSPSHYFHTRVTEPGYGVSDFLRDPVARPLIEHHQARFLGFEPGPDDWAFEAPIPRSNPDYRQAVFELCPLPIDEDTLLARASETIDRVDVVGVTERLDDTLAVLADTLGWPPLPPPPHLNATPGRLRADDLSDADLRLLKGMKEVDRELHEQATKRLAEDVEALAG